MEEKKWGIRKKNTANYFLEFFFFGGTTVEIQCRRIQSLSLRINRVKLLLTSSSKNATPHRFRITKAFSAETKARENSEKKN